MTWFLLEEFPRKFSQKKVLSIYLSRAPLMGMVDLSLSPSTKMLMNFNSRRKSSLTKILIEIYAFKPVLHSPIRFHKPQFCIEPDILEHLHIGEQRHTRQPLI